LFAVYNDADKNGEKIARLGVAAGTEFDDASGLPIISHTFQLND
jgi:hypothetical protein